MKTLRRILVIIPKSQRWRCIFILFLMIIGGILEAVGIGAILPLVSIMSREDFLLHNRKLQELLNYIGIYTQNDLIIAASCSMIILYILKNIFISYEMRQQINFVITNQIYFAHSLLREYLYKPYIFHLNTNPAVLIQHINNGAATAFSYIIMPILALITEMFTSVIIFLLLIYVDYITALFVALFLGGLLFLVLRLLQQRISLQGKIRNSNCIDAIKWLNQALGGVKEIKVSNRENFFINQYKSSYTRFGQAEMKYYFLSSLPKTIIESLVVSGLMLLIVFKILLGEPITVIVQIVGVLSLAAFRLMPGIYKMVGLINSVKYQMPLFDEIYEQLIIIKQQIFTDGNSQDKYNNHKRLDFNSYIVAKDISFSYPDNKKTILNDVNLQIPKGKFVGIVGESGAGKTTFVDLLLGLLTPSNGTFYIDQHNLLENIKGWHAILSYVPQSIYLTDATIKENIAFGVREDDIDELQIMKVLDMAELSDFVKSQPDGIDTMVGDRGVKLSGGQRQRIGIARALYTNPEVLILDEATSALDNKTEKEIMDTILKLKGKITIIAIAHRLSTLDECDFKIEFNNGKAKVV